MKAVPEALLISTKKLQDSNLVAFLVFVFAIFLYGNTLHHQFTQDDAIVIYDNAYVKKGISGIKDIFSKDTFQGFFQDESKSQLVTGGRYRPFSVVFFALIWSLFGDSPTVFHLLAIFIYAFLGLTLYKTILLFSKDSLKDLSYRFALIAVLFFVAHPVHTEVVANVKGMDESFALLLALASMNMAFRYIDSSRFYLLMISAGLLFCSFLSKESSAPFVLLTPLSIYLFKSSRLMADIWKLTVVYAIVFILYLTIRTSVVGWPSGELPTELMNNPFIKVLDGEYIPFSSSEKWASIMWSLAKYFQLLVFPHPLTHDYYPRFIDVVDFNDPTVILSVIMNASLLLIFLLGLKKKSFISYLIFFYYSTIALTSNILFPVGTHLSERFLFIPSLAFALWMAYTAIEFIKKYKYYASHVIILLIVSLTLLSAKTISRNGVWKDDFTLFTTDVSTSGHSAKVRNAAAGALLSKAAKINDPSEKEQLSAQAVVHLNKAIEIHPRYKNAHLLLGNAYFYQNQYERAISAYQMALSLDPDYAEAEDNLFLALREGARYAGSQESNINKALSYLNQASVIRPNDYETISLIGIAYGNQSNHRKALEYFEKAKAIQPNNARAYVNLGYAQLNMGLDEDAQISFQQALRIDPKSMDK